MPISKNSEMLDIPRSETRGLNVLKAPVVIVDDDAAIRDSLEILLSGRGFTCESYASATDFLNNADLDKCGCLLLDLHMPGVSGVELLEILRARSILTPAILMTGAADGQLLERAKKCGALAFLRKPIMRDELLGWLTLSGIQKSAG
jgi:FixJ family two-component response regulator